MFKEPLKTTITEMNLLYAHYIEMHSMGRLREAVQAWKVYERYATKFFEERGLTMPLRRW